MAKVEIISASEKMEGFSIYLRDGKKITRRKGGPSKERIANDPALVKVRQNASEFGNVSLFTKSIFDTLNLFTKGLRDPYAYFRLMKISIKLKSLDLKSAPGERNPLTSLVINNLHRNFLRFEFNVKIPVMSILDHSTTIDETTNTIKVNSLSIKNSLRKELKATDYNMQFARLSIDKISGYCSMEYSQRINIESSHSFTYLEFNFATPYSAQCTRLYLLRTEFNTQKDSNISKNGKAGNVIIIDTYS